MNNIYAFILSNNLLYFLIAVIVLQIISFVVAFILKKYSAIKVKTILISFIFQQVGVLLLLSFFIAFKESTLYGILTLLSILGLSIIFLSILLLIDKKIIKVDGASKNVISFAENKIKNEQNAEMIIEKLFSNANKKVNEDNEVKVLNVSKSKSKNEIDFTHVKNIIDRIETFNLSSSDKKQIKELKYLIDKSENLIVNDDLKDKINDSLGCLLKIMAKYN